MEALRIQERLRVAVVVPESAGGAAYAVTFLDIAARHRRRLWQTGLGAVVLFTAMAFLIPKRYEAAARLMPPEQGNTSSALMSAMLARGGDLLGSAGADMLGLHTPGATVVGVLKSRTVADDLIQQFDLRKVYGVKNYEEARRILARRSDISEDKKSGIISISVQDREAQRSAELARGYVANLNRRIENLSTSSARREREFLEQRLRTVKEQLDEASLRLSRFSSQNKTFDPAMQGRAMLEAASTLQGQLIAAETELSGLQQIYGPENARVKAASARVGELRSKLRGVSGAQDGSGQLGPSLEQLPLLGNTYADLARQAKIDEAVYEALTKQYEIAKVSEAKEVPSIRVLDEPEVPEKKVWPPRLLIILMGTLFTLICELAVMLLQYEYDQLAPNDPRRTLVRRIASAWPRRA